MSKTSRSRSLLRTSKATNASITSKGAGRGTFAPINSCSLTPISGTSFTSRRHCHLQTSPNFGSQFFWLHRIVGVAELPELFGVSEVFRSDVVEPVTFFNSVLGNDQRRRRKRQEAATQIN